MMMIFENRSWSIWWVCSMMAWKTPSESSSAPWLWTTVGLHSACLQFQLRFSAAVFWLLRLMLIFNFQDPENHLSEIIDGIDMALLQDTNGHVVIQAPAPVLGNSVAAAAVVTAAATPPPENTNNIFLYESSGNMYLPQVWILSTVGKIAIFRRKNVYPH